jgi:antitoxin (DNA-binding transcriptional repressor) of toxin-antitoxin stability system
MKLPTTEALSVGIREFRSALAEYIDADTPVTITRHGQTVGLFIPLRRPTPADVEHMQQAAADFRKAMPLSDDEVESIVADFEALRHGLPMPSRQGK